MEEAFNKAFKGDNYEVRDFEILIIIAEKK
jgi:hypothetical protein